MKDKKARKNVFIIKVDLIKLFYFWLVFKKILLNFNFKEINARFKYIFVCKHKFQGKVAERSNASVLKTDVT